MEREKKNMALDGDHESVRVVVKLVEHKAREVSDFVKRVFWQIYDEELGGILEFGNLEEECNILL